MLSGAVHDRVRVWAVVMGMVDRRSPWCAQFVVGDDLTGAGSTISNRPPSCSRMTVVPISRVGTEYRAEANRSRSTPARSTALMNPSVTPDRPPQIGRHLGEKVRARLDDMFRDCVEFARIQLHHVLVLDVVRLVDELLESGVAAGGVGV